MNNFSPDQLYDSIQARHQDIRNAEVDRQSAKLAQGDVPNRLQTVMKGIVAFTKRNKSQSVGGTQVSKIAQTRIGNEKV
jgi:hypothetical protein